MQFLPCLAKSISDINKSFLNTVQKAVKRIDFATEHTEILVWLLLECKYSYRSMNTGVNHNNAHCLKRAFAFKGQKIL